MDLVVTVPKSELRNVTHEETWAKKEENIKAGGYCFWKISRVPRRLNKGDRVYFIHNGLIVNYNIFDHVDCDLYCEVTDRQWDGLCLVMNIPSIPLKNPVPMKGFQGFRYIDRIE